MSDEPTPALPAGFDPEAPWVPADPAAMTDDERRIAAAQVLYDTTQRVMAIEEDAAWTANIMGLTRDEIDAVVELAEQNAAEEPPDEQ